MNPQPIEDPLPAKHAEERRFGYWTGHFVVMGSMIGSGILTTSGIILKDLGNPSALLGLWVIGGVLAICAAVSVAELATALPRSGGDYVFVREAFGRDAGFVSGWATFILGFAAPTAVIANLSLTYLTAPFTDFLNARLPVGFGEQIIPAGATVLILVIGITHMLGHRHSSRLQLAATILTASILLVISIGGLASGRGDWQHFAVGGWPERTQWPLLANGLILVGFAYGGWNAAGYLAGEIRDPAKTLPRSLIGGASTVMGLYLLVNVFYIYALDPLSLRYREPDEVNAIANLATRALFGPEAATAISIALGMGMIATVSAALLTGPRIAFAMARDRAFPEFAGRLHPTRRTPVAATLVHMVLAIVLAWSGTFQDLLNYASIGFVAISGLTVASVFPIRRRSDLSHPYRVPFYPFPPLAYLILIVWTIGNSLMPGKEQIPAFCSLGTILVGIPLARLLRRSAEK